jgi:hypothetical protein
MVSKDRVIAIWLQREFEGNWNYIRRVAEIRCPNLTRDQIREFIFNPNYDDVHENFLRFQFFEFRYPLLRPVCEGNWAEQILDETTFRELRVIAKDRSWVNLSNNTGRLSIVSENIFHRNPIRNPTPETQSIIHTINSISAGEIDTRLLLIRTNDSEIVTILEGNKSAVALYITCFLTEELEYEPLNVYMGNLESKSFWQW